MMLNVARIRPATRVNGPGIRAAVWVQGCTIGCPGCFNAHTHPHELRQAWDPARLAERLSQEDVEGVSILGGEPFQQAAACAGLAERSRELGLGVVTYSGYVGKVLMASRLPEVQRLLAATDLLIAGPFVQSKANDGSGWHGSSNQAFLFLSDRYRGERMREWDVDPVVEARVDGRVVDWNGIPVVRIDDATEAVLSVWQTSSGARGDKPVRVRLR